ncbi:MAG: hypothetical protein NC097_04610 [Clostridium sp.]|nr:hypothetical protein [Prevotella sp.]MCM1429059.1 hypothetical protein [Clostridium sp.]MCM1475410.1 hypothetical protein [Muribaculaceae bacterium]
MAYFDDLNEFYCREFSEAPSAGEVEVEVSFSEIDSNFRVLAMYVAETVAGSDLAIFRRMAPNSGDDSITALLRRHAIVELSALMAPRGWTLYGSNGILKVSLRRRDCPRDVEMLKSALSTFISRKMTAEWLLIRDGRELTDEQLSLRTSLSAQLEASLLGLLPGRRAHPRRISPI